MISNKYDSLLKFSPYAKTVFKIGNTDLKKALKKEKLLLRNRHQISALSEEYARLPGLIIDGIIRIPNLNLDFVLVEVSGPPGAAAENDNHDKGDRNKMGKNLKYMFKTIISKKGTPCIRTVMHLKLFGVHFCKDKMYVYSISMFMWDIPVFQVEASIKIPVEPILFASTMPRSVSEVFDLGEKIEHFAKEVKNFLAITDYGEDSDSLGSDLSSCSTPRVSPKKRETMSNGIPFYKIYL
ncbi:hypothetical protein BDB01DRAFT_895805 [Pilobolus umbonatus]|nr:hypothetical protein BDB01DRAFT_895805 [Pilobolus umbonatus]